MRTQLSQMPASQASPRTISTLRRRRDVDPALERAVLVRVEHPGRALLALFAEELVDHIAVRAKHGGLTVERADEAERVLGGRALGELGSFLDGPPERAGERLDRLAAADVRARQDALDGVRGERVHEL